MGASSYLRLLRLAPTVAALAAGAGRGAQQAVTAAADAATAASGGEGAWGVSAHLAHRQLIEEGGNGLSSGMVAGYIIISIVLVAVSGLMAGLVLGLLSLDKVDLEVAKRTGNDKQKWLVEKVEPFTRNPHYVMCALVVVNAACNTALPLFIDRLLNPLAAILISVTAVLIFAEIAPQAVCKRYGLEIGAYCAWLVRALMVVTAPVSWPLGKLLDYLLGEESALFRRQELKALVGIHAETQQDGSVGALTTDEVQVIQGALDMVGKTAESVMTPVAKIFMLSSEAIITQELLVKVIAAGHSRVPVYEGDNKQAIMGLILVKELVLVDEHAGVKVNQLRLREMPFLRSDIPLYDVLKIFRFGRRHMACLTCVATGDASTGKAASNGLRPTHIFRRPSPTVTTTVGQQVEEVVGIITIEDVLEELLQTEIIDETDQFEDNLQTVQATPQVSLKELPPHLSRFLSPRRSLHGFSVAAGRDRVDVARVSNASAASAATAASGQAAQNQPVSPRGGGAGHQQPQQQTAFGSPPHRQASLGSTGLPAHHHHRTGSASSLSKPSLGAAAAASALTVAGSTRGTGNQEALAAALAAGVRAAELDRAGIPSETSSVGGASTGGLANLAGRPPLPQAQRRSLGGGAPAAAGAAGANVGSGGQHVALEMGELHGGGMRTASSSIGEEDQHLVSPGRKAS